jgi:hypothetical protein
MNTPEDANDGVRSSLGYKPLSRIWAKIEIFLGLPAAGVGLLVGVWSVTRPGLELNWCSGLFGLGLFVMGSYLALAGHRSHLYQSSNEQADCLADRIDRSAKKD